MALTSCSSVFYQGDRNMYYPPESLGYEKEDHFFQASDGVKLHGWFFQAKLQGGAQGKVKEKPKGTIIQFHGNAQNISAHYRSLIWLTEHGYNLFTFDYRGYGRSEGEPNQEGVYRDGLAALKLAHELNLKHGSGKLVLFGQSLGGAISLRAFVDFEKRDDFNLIVMDSTFTSYQSLAADKLNDSFLTWLLTPLAYVLVSDKYAPEPFVGNVKQPVLVIHDRLDPVVGFEHGKKLFEDLKTEKRLWDYSVGSHIAVFMVDPKNRERFLRVLDLGLGGSE